jgi:hypothetical protein
LVASNLGSVASIMMKNLSSVTFSNALLANAGWNSCGRRQRNHNEKKQVSTEQSTVSSKVTGMNAGMLSSGLPPMFSG